jgi:hypothetical protein
MTVSEKESNHTRNNYQSCGHFLTRYYKNHHACEQQTALHFDEVVLRFSVATYSDEGQVEPRMGMLADLLRHDNPDGFGACTVAYATIRWAMSITMSCRRRGFSD